MRTLIAHALLARLGLDFEPCRFTLNVKRTGGTVEATTVPAIEPTYVDGIAGNLGDFAELMRDGVAYQVVVDNGGAPGAITADGQPFAEDVDRPELAALLPFLLFGKLPIDPGVLLSPPSKWRQAALSYVSKGSLPIDPRYINRPVKTVTIRTAERLFTIDGEIFESNGVRLVIDPISVRYLEGAEVDFVDNVSGGGFTIKNPNARSTCGCGSSFSV